MDGACWSLRHKGWSPKLPVELELGPYFTEWIVDSKVWGAVKLWRWASVAMELWNGRKLGILLFQRPVGRILLIIPELSLCTSTMLIHASYATYMFDSPPKPFRSCPASSVSTLRLPVRKRLWNRGQIVPGSLAPDSETTCEDGGVLMWWERGGFGDSSTPSVVTA